MGAAAIIALLIKLVPTILSLINQAVAYVHDKGLLEAGASTAIAAELSKLTATVATARAVETAAAATHAGDATDNAFDQDFKDDR